MSDVARVAGVSKKTVSRVVNNEPLVRPETTERVREAIASLGFRRNDIARSLAGAESRTIGLVVEDIANSFSSAIARAADEVVQANRHLLIIASHNGDLDQEVHLIDLLLEHRVRGLLVVPAARDHRNLKPELEAGVHVVFLDRPPKDIDADIVMVDNRAGARAAVENLIAQGHRRIALIGGNPRVYTTQERLAGYRAALRAHGIPLDNALVRLGPHLPSIGEVALDCLAQPDPPTAIFCSYNRITIRVLHALRDRSGPRVAVAGFDDFDTSDLLATPITIVSYDPGELGRLGADLLFRRIQGDRTRPHRVVVPTRLVSHNTPVGQGALEVQLG